MPAAPAASTPVPAAPAREVPPPPRAMPSAPRPGQILSGPRQPLPAGMRPAEPVRMVTGTPPATARSTAPVAPSPAMPSPGAPAARTPIARPGLAGQPAARPIVPPRPDLAAKLSQPRPAGPGAPIAPRPGVPMRQQGAPTPGQPIYRGPIRPGQPLMARQGQGVRPGGPAGVRPGGPRPMHPTSRGMVAPGIAPPPVEQQRRPGDKRGGRPQRDRIQEQENGRTEDAGSEAAVDVLGNHFRTARPPALLLPRRAGRRARHRSRAGGWRPRARSAPRSADGASREDRARCARCAARAPLRWQ